jgi:hypothetical protein
MKKESFNWVSIKKWPIRIQPEFPFWHLKCDTKILSTNNVTQLQPEKG